MLKFEGINVGTTIKAYDFEPCPGRTDRFVTGKILDNVMKDGAKFYIINCETDSAFGPDHNRIGKDVFVPMEMCFDFDERVVCLDGPCAVKDTAFGA